MTLIIEDTYQRYLQHWIVSIMRVSVEELVDTHNGGYSLVVAHLSVQGTSFSPSVPGSTCYRVIRPLEDVSLGLYELMLNVPEAPTAKVHRHQTRVFLRGSWA